MESTYQEKSLYPLIDVSMSLSIADLKLHIAQCGEDYRDVNLVLKHRSRELVDSATILDSSIFNNDCLILDYKTQHVITDYTHGMRLRQLTIESTARRGTEHIKNIIKEKWGYEPEQQLLSAQLEDNVGMREQRYTRLIVQHTEALNMCIATPDGSVVNMKVSPFCAVKDLVSDVQERTPSLPPNQIGTIVANNQQLDERNIIMQYPSLLTPVVASLQVSSGECIIPCMRMILIYALVFSAVKLLYKNTFLNRTLTPVPNATFMYYSTSEIRTSDY